MPALFGPGGNSESFAAEGLKHTYQSPKWLSARGLGAYEYQGGNGIFGSDETFAKIGEESAQIRYRDVAARALLYFAVRRGARQAAGQPGIHQKEPSRGGADRSRPHRYPLGQRVEDNARRSHCGWRPTRCGRRWRRPTPKNTEISGSA